MIYGTNGLDLNFVETRQALNIPVKGHHPRAYAADPMIDRLGKALEKIDYQQYLTRFRWVNLPEGLDSELIERVLYFCGSGMFFYIKDLNRFYFLPYAMSGEKDGTGIDFYGRFNKIKPYSFNGSTDGSGEYSNGKRISKADLYLGTQIRNNIVDIPFVKSEEDAKKMFEESGVVCWDSSPGLAYAVGSRNRDARSFIKYLTLLLTQTKSAAINSSGFNLFSSDTESIADIMEEQLQQIEQDRINGKLSAVVSNMLGKIENLQSNAPAAMADFFNALQSVDNLRLKSLGIQNDGIVQKSQYQNIQEQTMDMNDSLQVYFNAFMERVKFAAIVNSIWGLAIYPQPMLLPQGAPGGQQSMEEEGDDSQAQGGTGNA